MEEHVFTFFGLIPGVDHHNLHIVSAGFVLVLLALASAVLYPRLRNAKESVLPDRKVSLRSLVEVFLEMWRSLAEEIIGHDGPKYLPFIGSIFFFIFVSNLLGLIPGFLPPTENWVTGASVATIAFIAYHYFGIRANGLGYLKHFSAPLSAGSVRQFFKFILLFLPVALFQIMFCGIELISHFLRPVTLSVRLFANIFADHQVVGAFSNLVPVLVPIPFLVLGIFVSFMQAFIFTLLTTVYIGMAVAHEH